MPKSFKNILIIKPSSLGDIVLALPALSALRRSFPDADISWLVRPQFAPLLKNHPHLDETILFDRRFLGKAWYHPRAFAALLSLIRRLHHSRFDLVIDLQGLFRSASLGWLSGCPNRFGMASAREMAHIFYTEKISQGLDCVHLVDYYLKIIAAAGATDTGVEFVLPTDQAAVGSVGKLLTDYDIGADSYAVFIIGSAHSNKRWPLEKFAALAERISSQLDLPIVATGTEPERELVERLKQITPVAVTNLAGKTDLSELIAMLKQSRIVISNDTGPGHIAAALTVPAVLIFGRSNPARVAPYQRSNCVAAIEPDSRGLDINSNNPQHDIKAVTVDMVYERLCGQLKP